MASSADSCAEEPSAKRPCLEESSNSRYKTIELDMNRYDEWVRKLSPEDLLKVFDIGVKVSESAIFTVDGAKASWKMPWPRT